MLIDLDGTLLRHEASLPGAADLLAALEEASQRRGLRYAVLSNSTLGPRRISARLAAAGMAVAPEHIYTATSAACDRVVHLCTGDAAGAPPRVFNCCTEDVYELLEGRAEFIETVPEEPHVTAGACDAVIVGTPTNALATPDRQRTALRLVRAGATLLGTSADRVFPSDRGIEFGAGALTHMIAYAAGATPQFCGKPQAAFFLELCRRLDVRPERCLLIGDNLESDIAGGKGVGMHTVLVLSGITTEAHARTAPAPLRPDRTIHDLRELL